MRRSLCLSTTAALLLGVLPAMADDPPPSSAPTPGVVAPAAAAPVVATTTTTAADTPVTDTTAGPTTTESRSTDTVTVSRKIRPNRPWLITGGAILLGGYVTTAVVTMSSGRTAEDRNLLLPVAGPWLNLADRQCSGCENETRNVAMVIGSGVVQGVGAVMTVASFFIPEKVAAATITAGPLKMNVLPTTVGRSNGLGVGTVGVF